MRSSALLLALAVLHARAATIPAPNTEKKLPAINDALDDVSLDNNDSEKKLVDPTNTVKDVQNNLRNTIPENVPVKVIEEQPIIKTIALREDSNDYVPDNDDSSLIKRVEIDLKNPGPPQRQEHDSQKPITYSADKERAVVAIKQSIVESQSIFNNGIQDVTQRFKNFFENKEELEEVSKTIQTLRNNFDNELVKLRSTINSYLKPEAVDIIEGDAEVENPPEVKEVENRLKILETDFNSGINMLSEGVELLSILKEEDDQNLKVSGKADTETAPVQTGTATGTSTGTVTGTAPANPAQGSGTTTPPAYPVFGFIQVVQNAVGNALTNVGTSFQNFMNPSQNQNQSPSANSTTQIGFPTNLFQGLNLPNFFQQNQNTQQQQQQGTAQAGVQSDDAGTTERPNILQQIQNTWQNIVNPGQASQQQTQQSQNPITNFITGVNQGITNFFQPRPPTDQQATPNTAAQPAAPAPVQGTNSVPATPSTQPDPVRPAKETDLVVSVPVQNPVVQSAQVPSTPVQSAPVQSAPAQGAPAQITPLQGGPIQQIVQNSPIVKGITNAVQRIQGLSNPSKPRDSSNEENQESKGHGHGDGNNGVIVSGINTKSAPVNEQPEKVPVNKDGGEPAAELNKTE